MESMNDTQKQPLFDCNDFHNQINTSQESICFETTLKERNKPKADFLQNYNNIRFNARVKELKDKYYACKNP